MQSGESIQDMQQRYIHIINHLRELGKYFKNKDLMNKVLRCLIQSWQPKVTAILGTNHSSSINLASW
jgi:hypothetical protein